VAERRDASPRALAGEPVDVPLARPGGAALDEALDAGRDTLKALFPLPPARAKAAPRRTGRTVGAALALVFATLACLWVLDPAYRHEQFASAVGERRQLELADGSRLTLDTGTELAVSWHLRSRRVELRQGRARFAVAKAVVRPFEVDASRAQVRVVGTVFDVRRDPAAVQVVVYEGKVEVRRAGEAQAALVTPGRALRVGNDSGNGQPAAAQPVDIDAAGGWQQGRLVFSRTPLSQALAEMQRYRREPVRLREDPARPIGELALSGTFDSAQTDRALDLLPRILPVQVARLPDGTVEVRAR
jgi:transmembrane sensor